MGPAINHIVTPLPSGVIMAPKMTIITIAYLIFFLQKSASTIPDADIAYITSGIEMKNQMLTKTVKQKSQNPSH